MVKAAYPLILVFLAVAVALLFWYVYAEIKRNKQMKEFGNMKLLSTLMPTRSLLRQRLKFGLGWMALVAVILVAARLQFATNAKLSGKHLNVELVAVVDVSNSMLCSDDAPSRLDKAKVIINTFLENTDNIKLGLVEFAGTSVTRMPLTTDYGTAKMFVNSMSTSDISSQGTAVGAAIRQAQRCFSNTEGVTKCILLLTDAENHEDDAVATAEIVNRDKHILINVVGIGSKEGGNIQVGDSILHDAEGMPVLTKLDETIAKNIANAGKGVYFDASSPSDIVAKLFDQFQKAAEKEGVSKSSAISYVDKFEIFAWIAFFCLLIDALLMERKNHLVIRTKEFFGRFKKKGEA